MGVANQHEPETAASLMTTAIPRLSARVSAKEALDTIRRQAQTYSSLNYVYIADSSGHLNGVISLKTLLASPEDTLLNSLMTTDTVSVVADDDQEYVAQIALKQQLKAVPVLDESQKLLGAVPSHTILQILQAEYEEDALQAAGMPPQTLRVGRQRVFSQARYRLPWLFIGMFGGIAAAVLIGRFEEALTEEVLLAAFIPMVVYLADAAGVQVQTIYIRLIARKDDVKTLRYLGNEVLTALIIAAALGGSILGIMVFWFGTVQLAAIIALSVVATIIFASTVAVILPWFFQRFRLDPAVASGPIATIISDVASILIYFTIAWYTLQTFT